MILETDLENKLSKKVEVLKRLHINMDRKNQLVKRKNKEKITTKAVFPKKETYIGSHIKSKLGDEYASNKSYERYYKDLT
jgi:ribosomal protein S24E